MYETKIRKDRAGGDEYGNTRLMRNVRKQDYQGPLKQKKTSTAQRLIKVGDAEFYVTPYFDINGNPYLYLKEKKRFYQMEPDQTRLQLGPAHKTMPVTTVTFDGENRNVDAIFQNNANYKMQKVKVGDQVVTLMPITALTQNANTIPDMKVMNNAGTPKKYDSIWNDLIRFYENELRKEVVKSELTNEAIKLLEDEMDPIVKLAENYRNTNSGRIYEDAKNELKRI